MSGDHNMNQTSPGWRKRQIALDKKAENARELGLDYDIHSCSPFCTRPMCVQEAVQAEREACANDVRFADNGTEAAAIIRARGQA
jgi:hypothetical protein